MLSPKHLKYKIISSITQLPITAGALYAFDIDDTLIKRKKKFVPNFAGNIQGEKSYYIQEYYTVNGEDIEHIRSISKVATVIYITARDAELAEFTSGQFEEFNIPDGDIYFSTFKYKSLIDAEYNNYHNVYFVDDLDINCMSVAKQLPTVISCRIDKELYERMKNRRNLTV